MIEWFRQRTLAHGDDRTYRRLCGMALIVFMFLPLGGCYPLANIVDARIAAVSNPPSPLFDEYCAKYGGVHIHKTVENVKGFVLLPSATYAKPGDTAPSDQSGGGCFPCLNFLGKDGYDFVEAVVTQPKGYQVRNFDYAVEPGIYRYRLVKRESGKCERFDAKAIDYPLHSDLKRLHLEGWCVYAERIPALTAKYEFAYGVHLKPQPRLYQSRAYVRDRRTGVVLAERNAFFTPNVINRPGSCYAGSNLQVKDVLFPNFMSKKSGEAND